MTETTEVPDELVALAMTGDRRAVGTLLAIIRPLVVRYCRARLGRMDRSSVSADDVAQEVCLAVLTALPGYRVQGRPFLAFVYGIASHKVIDAHRAASRNRSEPVADLPDSVESADGPEQRALQVELSGEMARLLDTLPEKQREILILRVVVGLSAEETAEAVGSTPGAVRVAQHRALARLRKSMPEEEVV
ncbi:RNA polymerase sigma-70 factor, ECF subfamily [Pseudonocardia thermophila]|jgi:RNA polymerase sigma factor, sigma-70 family|uniref:RNA polymerase sigma-70 factor, ECF subfamily n=1 Tax=Pseudonocardia thermophila TaxID=1848 RepID=A0A1M6X354_PSETH|nr:sigma-70 family RNA polymerase sigma factor [Pseudonocardia thermophila]SHL00356.1 RNA polymerase sigma-70 factor, ECF subfamily [Pseudonocardia thermophila]